MERKKGVSSKWRRLREVQRRKTDLKGWCKGGVTRGFRNMEA